MIMKLIFTFSETHSLFLSEFKERSERMLLEFINSIEKTRKSKKRVRNLYYLNLARFDGIIVSRY